MDRAGKTGHTQANTTVTTVECSSEIRQTGRHTMDRAGKTGHTQENTTVTIIEC